MHVIERGSELVNYIPGIQPTTRVADLPTFFHGSLEAISWVPKCQYLLLTSIYELEDKVIDVLKAKYPIPIYSIGPATPKDHNDSYYMQWLDSLDSQPKGTVLYISHGSFLSVSEAQMDEIIAGVERSGVRFLWVACGEASPVKERYCGDKKGLVVEWCDQQKVLCHPSVGGFCSHRGWNSTKECLFAGVPFLAHPIFWDQIPISKMIVEDWKIG